MAVVGNAYVIVQAVTTGFNKQVQNAIKGINAGPSGQSVGKSFSKGFSGGSGGASKGFKRIAGEAEAARVKINGLIKSGYYLGPALAAGVGAIGSLVSGLFALGAQAASAAPALIVLPSIMSALAQGALAAKLAFGGLGKAIGALSKKSGGVDRMPAALEKLANAQERLDKAEKRAIKTNEALTKAYADAREEIEQLNFSVEDAALSEKKAALELEKARETLARVQDLPPNSRARKEAELAFAEAELGLRKAKDANNDLIAEQNKVTANGTRTSDEQIQNLESYKEAVEADQEAQTEALKATREVAKAKKEIQDIKAGKGGGGGEDPTADLSPEAKKFAEFIVTLKPKLAELREAAGKKLFGPLEESLTRLTSGGFFEMLKTNLEGTGEALGKAAISITDVLTSTDNVKKLDVVFKTNNDTIEKGGKIVGNLTETFITLLAAADPLIRRFTDWLVVLTDGWKETANANSESGKLTDTFNAAGDVAAQIGGAFSDLFSAIMDIGRAASGPGSGGQMLLDMFSDAMAKFKEFADTAEKNGSLEEYFRGVATNVGKISGALVEVVKQILKLGDRKEIGQVADSLKGAATNVGEMLDRLMGGSPALATFVENISLLILNLSETGGINAFFGILNDALDIINAIFGNETFLKIFGFLAIVKGVTLAFGALLTVAKIYSLSVVGTINKLKSVVTTGFTAVKGVSTGVTNLTGNFKAARSMGLGMTQSLKMSLGYTKLGAAATKAWTGIQAAFNAVMALNPIVLIVIAIAALVALFVVLYFKVEGFREIVDAVFGFMLDILKTVWNWISENWPLLLAILTGPIGLAVLAITSNWDTIKGAIAAVWNWIKDNWQLVLGFFTGPISAVVTAFHGLRDRIRDAIKGAWEWIRDNWKNVLGFFTGPIQSILRAWEGLRDGIRNIIKGAINYVIRAWNGIQFGIPGFKLGPVKFDGFTLKLPQIPELAQGGIIQPSLGGTLARIGEAGRAERIEPLDPDGLSKRDKAMIKLLAGPAGGIQVIVNPSPGMDEVELASLVSRQIAKQIRRGAA
jgi:hypothetical protein